MRLIKNKNIICEPFYRSSNIKEVNEFTNYKDFVSAILKAKTISEGRTALNEYLLTITRIKEIAHFQIDEKNKIIAVDGTYSSITMTFFKRIMSERLISIKKETELPQKLFDTISKNEYLIFVKKDHSCANILVLHIANAMFCETELLSKIHSSLLLYLSLYENLVLRRQLNQLHTEISSYEAKFSNQYNYSAIGEMTSGIIEEILNPLQVILSYADLLGSENESTVAISSRIKMQVQKVEGMIQRLLKFASARSANIEKMPVNINLCIKDLYALIKSSLQISKIEIAFDFDETIPLIISNKIFLNQIITNVFTIIKNSGMQNEGLLLQTRCINNSLLVKIIFTGTLSKESAINEIHFIEKMMNKHDGTLKTSFGGNSGSMMELLFPIKRNVA